MSELSCPKNLEEEKRCQPDPAALEKFRDSLVADVEPVYKDDDGDDGDDDDGDENYDDDGLDGEVYFDDSHSVEERWKGIEVTPASR